MLYNNKNTQNNGDEDRAKKIFCYTIAGILLCIAFVWFIVVMVQRSKPQYEIIGQPSLTVEYNKYTDYTATVKGALKNISGRDCRMVMIEYAMYDASGHKIGTAYDTISNLKNGEIWHFEASLFFSDDKPVKATLSDVTMG